MKSDVSVEVVGSVAHVFVSGELDYDNCDALVDAVAATLETRAGLSELQLDFAGLTAMHTSALAAVLLVHRKAAAAGTRLRLVNRPAFLDHTLNVTGLREHLTGRRSMRAAPVAAHSEPTTPMEQQSL